MFFCEVLVLCLLCLVLVLRNRLLCFCIVVTYYVGGFCLLVCFCFFVCFGMPSLWCL